MPDEKSPAAGGGGGTMFNMKDSRWLQLEVCREFQRGQCSRTDQECKFAHPPPHVEIQNGRVTACYDSIKGRCSRENPKCKYLHPPQHLKDQLLITGRNNLVFKNLLANQLAVQMAAPMNVSPHVAVPSASAAMFSNVAANAYNPYSAYALNTAAAYMDSSRYMAAAYPQFISTSPESLNTVPNQLPFLNILPYGTTMASLAAMQKAAINRAERVDTAAHAALVAAASNNPYAAATIQAQAQAQAQAASMIGKKRPLELDTGGAAVAMGNGATSAATEYLLAAAALNSPVNKRAAIEKGGVPVVQPVTHHPAVSNFGATFQYPHQFANIPGLTTSYIPTVTLTGNPTTLPRYQM